MVTWMNQEAIAGKCSVICTSADSRNPQPSVKELQMADYVFYRIFDVKSCTISDKFDDKVGGLEGKLFFLLCGELIHNEANVGTDMV